jgi:uncharacterized iron-regulated membrane protein
MSSQVTDRPMVEPSSDSARISPIRRSAMRVRKPIVQIHRWLAIGLLAWLVVISVTGAWIAQRHAIDSWLHGDRYESSAGDVGAAAAVEAATAATGPETAPSYVVMPANARGVYRVDMTMPDESTRQVFVDPGTGSVNAVANPDAGIGWWMYRGHMHLWQDEGVFGLFDAQSGWCGVGDDGIEPGGVRGVVCDVIPDGDDMVAWFGVAWIVVLVSGFYVWYWPGVRRWAAALVIRRGRGRFAFNMSLHKVVGIVVWAPLLVVALTGIAFAFPNLHGWYDNVTPAGRGEELWTPPDSVLSVPNNEPLDLTEVRAAIEERFPDRRVESLIPATEETALVTAWVTRGFSPWSREGGAGNVLVGVDQYSGEVLYDGTPEDIDVFGQAWQDWSFPLHAGDFGGPITRIVWVVLALTPLALGTTGVTMQLVRRSKRRRRIAG